MTSIHAFTRMALVALGLALGGCSPDSPAICEDAPSPATRGGLCGDGCAAGTVCDPAHGCVACGAAPGGESCSSRADCDHGDFICRSGRCTEQPACTSDWFGCGLAIFGPSLLCDESSGDCVECRDDADCAGSPRGPYCGEAHACVRCRGDGDCGGSTPRCAGGVCASCRVDADCPSATPVCGVGLTCLPGCITNADCPNEKPTCRPSTGDCLECVLDGDCPRDEPRCRNGGCAQCDFDADCAAPTSHCDFGTCVVPR